MSVKTRSLRERLIPMPGIRERLYPLMRARGLTQVQLAKRAGFSRQTLTLILTHEKASAEALQGIADALEVDVTTFGYVALDGAGRGKRSPLPPGLVPVGAASPGGPAQMPNHFPPQASATSEWPAGWRERVYALQAEAAKADATDYEIDTVKRFMLDPEIQAVWAGSTPPADALKRLEGVETGVREWLRLRGRMVKLRG